MRRALRRKLILSHLLHVALAPETASQNAIPAVSSSSSSSSSSAAAAAAVIFVTGVAADVNVAATIEVYYNRAAAVAVEVVDVVVAVEVVAEEGVFQSLLRGPIVYSHNVYSLDLRPIT